VAAGLARAWLRWPVDRFGARPIDVGYAEIRLVVEYPPRILEAGQRIAAQHVVLTDERTAACKGHPGHRGPPG
jgi:hypothetical protein